jgi:Tetratricopeptide repeat
MSDSDDPLKRTPRADDRPRRPASRDARPDRAGVSRSAPTGKGTFRSDERPRNLGRRDVAWGERNPGPGGAGRGRFGVEPRRDSGADRGASRGDGRAWNGPRSGEPREGFDRNRPAGGGGGRSYGGPPSNRFGADRDARGVGGAGDRPQGRGGFGARDGRPGPGGPSRFAPRGQDSGRTWGSAPTGGRFGSEDRRPRSEERSPGGFRERERSSGGPTDRGRPPFSARDGRPGAPSGRFDRERPGGTRSDGRADSRADRPRFDDRKSATRPPVPRGDRPPDRNAPRSSGSRPGASDAFRQAVDRERGGRAFNRDPRAARTEGAEDRKPKRAWQADRTSIERDRVPEPEATSYQRSPRPHEIVEQVPLEEKRKARKVAGRPWEAAGWERETEVVGRFDDAPHVVEREVDAGGPDARTAKRRAAPEAVVKELNAGVGARRGTRLAQELMDASKAFERERFGDALRTLRPLAEEAPDVAAVRELMGLCLYRQGKWAEAIRHLQHFCELTGSVEQHPVLADCHRALRHYTVVEALWEELSSSSPSAELVAEGRIVTAGSYADQGKLGDAIKLMERASLSAKRPKAHHFRLWYALADLYERAGDLPRARELFERVASHGEFADVSYRLANL